MIRVILFIFAMLVFAGGCSMNLRAESEIHEIEAFLFYLISSVLFVGACIIDQLAGISDQLSKKVKTEDYDSEEETGNLTQNPPKKDYWGWGLVIGALAVALLYGMVFVVNQQGIE